MRGACVSFFDEFIEALEKLEQKSADEIEAIEELEQKSADERVAVHGEKVINRFSCLREIIEEIGAGLLDETAFYKKKGLELFPSKAQWLALQVSLSSMPVEAENREAYKESLDSAESVRSADWLIFQIKQLKSARAKVTARQFIRTFLQAFEATGNRRPKNRITAEIVQAAIGNSIDSEYGVSDEYVKGVVKELVRKGELNRVNVKSTPRK